MQTAAERWAFRLCYDENPNPDECFGHSLSLARLYRDESQQDATLLFIGTFLGYAWSRWPDRIDGWTRDFISSADPGRKLRRVLYIGLGMCPDVAAKKVLDELVPQDDADAAEIDASKRLRSIDLTTITPEQPAHIQMLWGAFFGSGDARFVIQICKTIPWLIEKQGIRQEAVAREAYTQLCMYLDNNHFGLLSVMNEVHEAVPDLKDTIKALTVLEKKEHVGHQHDEPYIVIDSLIADDDPDDWDDDWDEDELDDDFDDAYPDDEYEGEE